MSPPCPECGAELGEADSCQAIFESFLVLDYTDPGYGQVHALTVACFMIQHGHYSDEALAWILPKLRAMIDEGLTNEGLRRLAARDAGPSVRTWKVKRPAGSPAPKIAWSMTIADVAANAHDAASYREWVRRWARTIVEQMASSFPPAPPLALP